jgi:predicted O-methyltransferase YrrM
MEQPPLVRRALELASGHGFERSCLPEDGALLHVLAARRGITRAAEIGTGAGAGAAWIASALPPGVPLFTSEIDPELAALAAGLFVDDPDVTVLVGPWQETLPAEAPFDFVFVDGGSAKDDVDAVIGILAPGATAVLDDFWHDPSLPDPRRDSWLQHPLLATVELWVTRRRRALVAVRR